MRIKLLILVVALSSCISQKKRAEICSTCPSKTKDSVITVIKDTTIYITRPGETVIVPNPCAELCDSFGNVRVFTQTQHKNGITTTLRTERNKLIVLCKADSLEAIIKGLRSTNTFRSETITAPKVEKSRFQTFINYWFWVTAALIVGYFGYKLLPLLKLFKNKKYIYKYILYLCQNLKL